MTCRCASDDAEACAFVAGASTTCACTCHAAAPAPRAPRVEPWRRIAYVHTCLARGCEAPIALDRLMCAPCWRRVPKALQDAVWRAYVPGQELAGKASRAYADAARAAIDAVAKSKREELELVDARKRQGNLFG